MTFTPVPVLRNGQLERLAQDCPGFSDEEERLIHDDRKTIFIAGASAASQGRAATASAIRANVSGFLTA